MGQKLFEVTKEDLFERMSFIIDNGGEITQVISVGDKFIILYSYNYK